MAKKSKTQRAKASAARQARKAERELQPEETTAEEAKPAVEEKPKKPFLKKAADDGSDKKPAKKEAAETAKKAEKKADSKPKKKRFKFFHDVKGELKRVTWPTRTDVLRWTGVVVVALIFFGVFVALLDNVIITPLLVLISGIGA